MSTHSASGAQEATAKSGDHRANFPEQVSTPSDQLLPDQVEDGKDIEDRGTLRCRAPRDQQVPQDVAAITTDAPGDVQGNRTARPEPLVPQVGLTARQIPPDLVRQSGEFDREGIDVETLMSESVVVHRWNLRYDRRYLREMWWWRSRTVHDA
jgi:hypothetical protein